MKTYTNKLTGEVIDLSKCEDNEVLDLDTDGCVVQWSMSGEPYNSGEKLAEFGSFHPHELPRVGLHSTKA